MSIPRSSNEWNEFAKDFSNTSSGLVLGAVGGDKFEVPLAACAGGYYPVMVCVSAIIRNLADNTDRTTDEVMSDISDILETVAENADSDSTEL